MQPFTRYAHFYESLNKNKDYEKEIKFIYKWADKPKSILDLGAGTASYWQHFPKGVTVRGVERSLNMICQSNYACHIAQGDFTKKFYWDRKFDCVTALFDVVNYIPNFKFIKSLPLEIGGKFVFDMWDCDKINRDGFQKTTRCSKHCKRVITPLYDGDNQIVLQLDFHTTTGMEWQEKHRMYLHSEYDITSAMGKSYKIKAVKDTNTWQKWYLLERIK